MKTATAVPAHFTGCDVGKASIVVFDSRTDQSHTVANRTAVLRPLAALETV